ncbi:hypothetical protein SAMN05443572_10224 [Myxococcus fulvus]|nr:hypothetical protein SAMN05443572_10224 [Myxococcus fulvus]
MTSSKSLSRVQGRVVPGWTWLVAVVLLAGCRGPEGEPSPSSHAPLSLKGDQALGPECEGVELTCPEGYSCAWFDLGAGREIRCVQSPAICDLFTCSSGECMVLESHPLQIRCSGS